MLVLAVHAHHPSASTTNTPASNPHKQPKEEFQWTKGLLITHKTATRVKDCARSVTRVRARPRSTRFGTRTSALYWMKARIQGNTVLLRC